MVSVRSGQVRSGEGGSVRLLYVKFGQVREVG